MDTNLKKFLPAVIIAIGLVIMGIFIYLGYQSRSDIDSTGTMGNVISKEEAKEIALNFVNNQMLQGQVLANIVGVEEEKGLYKLDLVVSGNSFNAYITKDGKLFFTEGILIDEFDPNFLMQPQAPVDPMQDLPPQF